ncbi:phage tail assembly chaperone G [Terribacillus saccharophilus]|uniref:phage tail assembly chaperone G n=1 Tax=Terribacillus saccharophilus TaxID=361277 RepID=UPI002DC8C509|nr:hypothetical protein [Terribacillus saccharophilus]MEC0288806.1 hypothetical protein [Terribacillus saccharophilus]
MALTLKLTLTDDKGKQKEKLYTINKVKAVFLRKALEQDMRIDYTEMKLEVVDELVGFCVDVFGHQFSADEFYEGLNTDELFQTVGRIKAYCRGVQGITEANPPAADEEFEENKDTEPVGK